ncbi:Uncharacterised protein [Klebsiella pneumoniae]|nr:Uncharacterised protein [Klebsiella pneumoniae]
MRRLLYRSLIFGIYHHKYFIVELLIHVLLSTCKFWVLLNFRQ